MGVEFVSIANSNYGTVVAELEVIVIAGAVHTPQILQVSGIGNAGDLKRFGIKSVVNFLWGQPKSARPSGTEGQLQLYAGFLLLCRLQTLTNTLDTSNHSSNGGSLQSNATYAAEQRAL